MPSRWQTVLRHTSGMGPDTPTDWPMIGLRFGRGSRSRPGLAHGDSVRTPVNRSERRTGSWRASDQLFYVVETVGLEPTAFCLQSRSRLFADQRVRASSEVSGHLSSTLRSTVATCRAMKCGLCVDSRRLSGVVVVASAGSSRGARFVPRCGAANAVIAVGAG